MKVKLIENHDGEGTFPVFKSGTNVKIVEDCKFYINWQKCFIDNMETYIPKTFIECGKLVCDYNPTELVCKTDDVVEVIDIVYGWLYASKDSIRGWVPSYKCISII